MSSVHLFAHPIPLCGTRANSGVEKLNLQPYAIVRGETATSGLPILAWPQGAPFQSCSITGAVTQFDCPMTIAREAARCGDDIKQGGSVCRVDQLQEQGKPPSHGPVECRHEPEMHRRRHPGIEVGG